MKYFLSFCFLIAAFQSNAQSSEKMIERVPLAIYWEPSAIISGYHNSSLRFGIEAPVVKNISVNIAGSRYWAEEYGFKAALKIYLNPTGAGLFQNETERVYVGAEYAYKAHSYTITDSLRDVGEIKYNVSKYASSYSVIIGDIATVGHGFYYDFYVGAGVRERTASNTLTVAEEANLYHWHEGMVNRFSDSKSDHALVPHIALGVRLGYRFL